MFVLVSVCVIPIKHLEVSPKISWNSPLAELYICNYIKKTIFKKQQHFSIFEEQGYRDACFYFADTAVLCKYIISAGHGARLQKLRYHPSQHSHRQPIQSPLLWSTVLWFIIRLGYSCDHWGVCITLNRERDRCTLLQKYIWALLWDSRLQINLFIQTR